MHSRLELNMPQSWEIVVIALESDDCTGALLQILAAVVWQQYVCILAANSEEEDALQLELYYKFLQAQAEGFDGAFDEYISKEIAQPVIDSMPEEDIPEEVSVQTLPTKHNNCILCTVSCLAILIWCEAKGKLG